MDLLPRPFERGPSWRDDPHLGIGITLLFFGTQVFRDRILQRDGIPNSLGPAEAGLHGPLVLINRIKASHEVANQQPGYQANNNSPDDSHKGSSFARKLHRRSPF